LNKKQIKDSNKQQNSLIIKNEGIMLFKGWIPPHATQAVKWLNLPLNAAA